MKPEACFYKILFNYYFTWKLRIPPDFVKKYGDFLGPKATLKTDLSRKSWSVKIQKIGQHHFFTNGWSKFVQDFDLQFSDFLLFNFVGTSAFNVSVYEITGGEKEFINSCGDEDGSTHLTNHENSLSTSVRSWTFSKELKKHNFTNCRLEFPKCFALGTGIAENRNIKLEDGEGREWAVKVTDRNRGNFGFSAGWKDFLRANENVVVGSTILFEFIPNSDNVIQARVVENGTRKRGRRTERT